jgi:hypothetical protein
MPTLFRRASGLLARAFLLSAMLAGFTTAASATIIPLTLINGWVGAPFGTHQPGFVVSSNIVHFQGAIATAGTNNVPFILPPGFRPSVDV